MWCLHCTAVITMYIVAARHGLIPELPEQARDVATLCCRIISGISILDPAEPSAMVIWYSAIC